MISIITVVLNGVKYLPDTIESIIPFKNNGLEFLIIDGASTDGTLDIIKQYEKYIDKCISEKDNGIYDAFNKGWNLAKPENFILFLGAGDKILSLPTKTSFETADIIYGNVIINKNQLFKSKCDFRLKLGNTIHHQAMMVKKSLFPNSPFDTKFKTYADFDFTQRLLKGNYKFVFDKNFNSYALPEGVSQNFNEKESLSVVKKNFGSLTAFIALLYYRVQDIKNKF